MVETLRLPALPLRKRPPAHGLLLGVPNTGRLMAEVLGVLRPQESSDGDRQLVFHADGLTICCARSNDLPYLLDRGLVDAAITGFDYVVDSGVPAVSIADTGFQDCEIAVVGPVENTNWRSIPDLKVATQYPGIAHRFLADNRLESARVLAVSGSAEVYPYLGLADILIDAYMTGETARQNGLVRIEPIFRTSGQVFVRPDDQSRSDMLRLVQRLGFDGG